MMWYLKGTNWKEILGVAHCFKGFKGERWFYETNSSSWIFIVRKITSFLNQNEGYWIQEYLILDRSVSLSLNILTCKVEQPTTTIFSNSAAKYYQPTKPWNVGYQYVVDELNNVFFQSNNLFKNDTKKIEKVFNGRFPILEWMKSQNCC